jgi:hypothetical protein
MNSTILPDHNGTHYIDLLNTIHSKFRPRTYLEIGTRTGDSLTLANCPSISIDPNFLINKNVIGRKSMCAFFQCTSDDYFANHDSKHLLNRGVDFAFLDGLHLFEFLLRDFMHTERICESGSLIAMHDCIPTDVYIAERKDDPVRRQQMGSKPSWWTGDVWKILPILRKWRPDLTLIGVDCAPTGLLMVTDLNPASTVLENNYDNIVEEFMAVDLNSYGLERFHAEVETRSAASVNLRIMPWGPKSAQPSEMQSAITAIENPDSAVLQRLVSPAFTMRYPNVLHSERIPSDVINAVERSWNRQYFSQRDITISAIENAIVASEGLVFTSTLDLLQPSITGHSAAEIASARNSILAGMESGTISHLKGTIALCKKRGVGNYGHWIMEMLPKAYLVQQHWLNPVRYMVHSASGQLGDVIRQTLFRLGISGNQILEVGPTPTRVDLLLMVDGLTEHGSYMSPLVNTCIHAVSGGIPSENLDYIFVLREGLSSRRLIGEAEISAYAVERGYTLVNPSNMSFERQVAHFKSAKKVVGVMGAALTNIAFMPPGAQVVSLAPAAMSDTFYWFIAGIRGLRYTEVRCEQVSAQTGPMPWDTDLSLDIRDRESIFSAVS